VSFTNEFSAVTSEKYIDIRVRPTKGLAAQLPSKLPTVAARINLQKLVSSWETMVATTPVDSRPRAYALCVPLKNKHGDVTEATPSLHIEIEVDLSKTPSCNSDDATTAAPSSQASSDSGSPKTRLCVPGAANGRRGSCLKGSSRRTSARKSLAWSCNSKQDLAIDLKEYTVNKRMISLRD
jgi:hypothetical protein